MELFAYWQKNPPLHLMVKAYLGFEGSEPSSQEMANIPIAGMLPGILKPGERGGNLRDAPQQDRERFEGMKKRA